MTTTLSVGLYKAFKKHYYGEDAKLRADLKECADEVKKLVDSSTEGNNRYSNRELDELFAYVVTDNPTRNKYHLFVFLSYCACIDFVNGDMICYQYLLSMQCDISELEF